MKRKSRKPVADIAKLSISIDRSKIPAVNLGALQDEFVFATKALKSANTKLENAQNAVDVARQRQTNASEKLKASSRAVLAG